jgi:hypothetical protein
MGCINLRFIPKEPAKPIIQKFVSLSKIETISEILKYYKEQYHCYFAVATRVEDDGSRAGILQIPTLWIDIDTHKMSDEEFEKIQKCYDDFPLRGSAIVSSGGGSHIYWKLKQPTSKEEVPKVEDYLKRLASYFHADMASTDASRILRAPGSFNFKYDPPREVAINYLNPRNEYDLSDFDFLPLPQFEESRKENNPPPDWQIEVLSGVSEGERNISLTKLAGRYIGKSLLREEILPILLDANSRFNPPLEEKEVSTILDSVFRTDARNHPHPILLSQSQPSWPEPLAKEGFYGLAGEFVELVEPHTEADPVAILIQMLAAIGNIIGAGSYFKVEADQHFLKIFPVLVGETSKARKGTSWGYIKHVLKEIDPGLRIVSGLSSGEGLIWGVRDEIRKSEPIREKGEIKKYQEVIIDPGEADKRLLVIEQEFASTLRVLRREGNILSPVLREAWDDGNLRILSKNSPAQATGAHISVIGHITKDELKRYLDRTEMGNGFANRFIWLCVKRSKSLPAGGNFLKQDLKPIVKRIKECVEFGKTAGELTRDTEAERIWGEVYPTLSEGKSGLWGAVISRGEAQAMRLASIYAILDLSKMIRKEHLLAALAVWDYAEASARFIFGDAIGDPIADQILESLRYSKEGLTRTEISNLFSRHREKERISEALGLLQRKGFIFAEKEISGGRPVEKWKPL